MAKRSAAPAAPFEASPPNFTVAEEGRIALLWLSNEIGRVERPSTGMSVYFAAG